MKLKYLLPHQEFPALFEDVQMAGIFEDSKTFVDSVPKSNPAEIINAYQNEKSLPGFDLTKFVKDHFHLPQESATTFESDQNLSTSDHITNLWSHLKREDTGRQDGSSLLPLNHPYIVPGGRFREVYYWDSYFTMLGLAVSDEQSTIENMVQNFARQIDLIGHIPNGNRTYFLSRSQPPFFSLMVELLASNYDDNKIQTFISHMEQEYHFWMSGTRVVDMGGGLVLNRYDDDLHLPRPESYREDVELAQSHDSEKQKSLYRNIRAACESGWDFSSRWFDDPLNLSSIRTTSILPIDLNCLLLNLERVLEEAMYLNTNEKEAAHYRKASLNRVAAIQKYFWDQETEFYRDYDMEKQQRTKSTSMAAFFPLFVGIANEDQARLIINNAENKLLMPGGWQTTDVDSGQQWDAPNGWAPLQWIAFIALRNYGFESLAEKGARRWLDLNDRVFHRTGKMMEKYNVADLSLDAGGGEYPVQDGFGWTNGVYLALLDQCSKPD